jgi:hypothetical protein
MPARPIDELVRIALGELQHRVLVLIAEKELLEDGIAVLKQKVADHRCGNPIELGE